MQPSEEVEYILTECFLVLGQNVGSRIVAPEALRFWRDRYRERFLATLTAKSPRAWQDDRLNVLAKAASLGRKAAQLADRDSSAYVTLRHAQRASEANDCRPRAHFGMFSIWCMPTDGKAPGEVAPSRSVPWFARLGRAGAR